MIDKTILLNPVTRTCVGNMFNNTAMLMPTVLVCPTTESTHGHGGARWRTPPLSEDNAMDLMDVHRAVAHSQQIGGGDGEAEADHDAEWSWPGSSLQEIPRPVLQGKCSQEDFNFFRREWQRYVRYYRKVDTNEIGAQLLNCLDRALQLFVHRDLGGSADNATQADMLRVIELLVVEEVETDMYENLDVRNDALYPTKVEVFLNGNTMEEVKKDVRQEVVVMVGLEMFVVVMQMFVEVMKMVVVAIEMAVVAVDRAQFEVESIREQVVR